MEYLDKELPTPQGRVRRDKRKRDDDDYDNDRRRDNRNHHHHNNNNHKRRYGRESATQQQHRRGNRSRNRNIEDYENGSRGNRGRKTNSADEDVKEVFLIRVENDWQKFDFVGHKDLRGEGVLEEDRMLSPNWCNIDVIRKLWEEKSRMDAVFDNGNERVYYQAREKVWPEDSHGSTRYSNRAGDKLNELYDIVKFFDPEIHEECIFADVCGAPGAWTQFLLQKFRRSRGFGMSLKIEGSAKAEVWYKHLEKDPRFTIVRGVDGTGNIYLHDNVDMFAKTISRLESKYQGGDDNTEIEEDYSERNNREDKQTIQLNITDDGTSMQTDTLGQTVDLLSDEMKRLERFVNLVVADGGFRVSTDANGKHIENFQELLSARIILSELYAALRILTPRGNYVCKLFDCFSHFTASIVFLCCHLFRKVYVVKPPHSRRVNSERYLVALDLIDNPSRVEEILDLLCYLHKCGFTNTTSPKSAVPVDDMLMKDEKFVAGMREMCTEISKSQTDALHLVMDYVDDCLGKSKKREEIIANESSSNTGTIDNNSNNNNNNNNTYGSAEQENIINNNAYEESDEDYEDDDLADDDIRGRKKRRRIERSE